MCGATRGVLLAAALLSSGAGALQAQVTGRWAMLLGGGVRGASRGELRLASDSGSLWLDPDTAPVPLRDLRVSEGAVQFRLPGARLAFSGVLRGDVIRGTARADTGAPRIWTATRLQEMTEYYPVLPRFTLRQVIIGRRDTRSRLPGMWVAAARSSPPDLTARYHELAGAAGLEPLTGSALEHEGPARALGLAHRDEVVQASQALLEKIRAQIPAAATRAAFDRIFRPAGAWLVDMHDAVLVFARAASPGAGFDDAASALKAVGWLPADSAVTDVQVMTALYRLRGLRESDSAQVTTLLDDMQRADPQHATAARLLFSAYDAAYQWHTVALRFLLAAPWIGDGGPPSIAARMRASWGDSLPLPMIESRYFGSPQAVPRYGVPAWLFRRVVVADNWSAERWLDRHHPPALLAALRLLPAGLAPEAELEAHGETFRLATVRQEAESRDNGFLEPADAIVVDAGYMPLLALAATVHEWEHLVFESRRRHRDASDTGDVVTLHGSDPYVAEGVAEWRTDQLLRPLAAAFPLLLAGEAEKRVRLAADGAEPHALGFLLVRALADAVPDSVARLDLLLDAADNPSVLLTRAGLRSTWARYRNAPDLPHGGAARRALIPETTFTVEDGFPDPVAVRILVGRER